MLVQVVSTFWLGESTGKSGKLGADGCVRTWESLSITLYCVAEVYKYNLCWFTIDLSTTTCRYYTMSSEITIPTDVLCDIFHLLCDGPITLHDLKNESHLHEFPWAVGQVCRHWRGAFLSYTQLWTSFSLEPGTFSPAYFVEMNRRATIYLERSGQQPLTIDVSMPCSGTKTFPKTVWGILLSCLKRWKKANLVLGNGAAQDELFRCRGYTSSLESLRMTIPDSLAMKHYNAFQVAPHLTELDLAHLGYAATWQFPWAQLTKLKLDARCEEFNKDSNNLWGVLYQLEKIEELHIITTFRQVRRPSPLPIVHLPGLRLLEISLASYMMFSWFTAPLLEHLHVHGSSTWDQLPYEGEITSLIQRSSCHIRRLELEKCGRAETRRIVKALASVEELYFNRPFTIDVIQDITGLDDGRIYLPKLQVLQVTCYVHGYDKLAVLEHTVTLLSRLLQVRGEGLASHDTVPLKKFVLRLTLQGKCPGGILEVMHGWPS